jgi:hypothetical protein
MLFFLLSVSWKCNWIFFIPHTCIKCHLYLTRRLFNKCWMITRLAILLWHKFKFKHIQSNIYRINGSYILKKCHFILSKINRSEWNTDIKLIFAKLYFCPKKNLDSVLQIPSFFPHIQYNPITYGVRLLWKRLNFEPKCIRLKFYRNTSKIQNYHSH